MKQYDLELEGEFSEIFKAIRKILLSYPQIKELKIYYLRIKSYTISHA